MGRITRLAVASLTIVAALGASAAAASAMVLPPQPDPIVIIDR